MITESLLRDLHIDRVAPATVNLWGTLIGAACCLLCVRLLDRFGSRIVLAAMLSASEVGDQQEQRAECDSVKTRASQP